MKAIEQALSLGKSKDTIYLPGWRGPVDDDEASREPDEIALLIWRLVGLTAESAMERALEGTAKRENHKRYRESNNHQPP